MLGIGVGDSGFGGGSWGRELGEGARSLGIHKTRIHDNHDSFKELGKFVRGYSSLSSILYKRPWTSISPLPIICITNPSNAKPK